MDNRHYILDDTGRPVPCDCLTWARWIEANNTERIVAHEQVGKVLVSTVFLGLNYRFSAGDPILWETMIFGGPRDGSQWRATSEEKAKLIHRLAVALATAANQRSFLSWTLRRWLGLSCFEDRLAAQINRQASRWL